MTAIAHPTDAAPDDERPDREGDAGADQRSVTAQGFRLIWRLVKLHPTPFALSLIGGVGWAALVVATSYVLGRVTDEVIDPAFKDGVEASAVWWAVAALILVSVLRGLSVIIRRWFGSLTEARMQVSLRSSVVDRLLVMPFRSYRARSTGELLANSDVDVLTTTQMLMPLPFSLGVVALAFFSLISLFLADWAFALVALLLFPALAFLSRYYTNRVHRPAASVQARLGEVSSIAHESFDGALVVKTLGREAEENARFADAADSLRTERLGVAKMTSVFEPMIDMLPNLGTIALLLVGAGRIESGAVSAGQLVQAVALFGWLAFPMRIVGFMFEALPRAVVSIARVDGLLAEPTDPAAESGLGTTATGAATGASGTEPNHLPDGPLGVDVDNVAFAYGDAVVLHGVSFTVAPAEVVALVGSTGSGKSTLANLLVRLDDPASGHISYGGIDLTEIPPTELRDAVSVAFQESFLFAAPITDNVRLGREIDGSAVGESLDRARASRFVGQLPAGDATVVGERGVTLSGGQRQRVALARALAGRPRVLVLDDATSAVDPTIEAEILGGLRQGDTTMLIVAHRLSTIMLADRVVHLDAGRVRGIGTHTELLADPEYAALVTAYETKEVFDEDIIDRDDPDDRPLSSEGSVR